MTCRNHLNWIPQHPPRNPPELLLILPVKEISTIISIVGNVWRVMLLRLTMVRHERVFLFLPELAIELCEDCRSSPQEVAARMGYRMKDNTNHLANSHLICTSCARTAPGEPVECDSLDCPWFFARKKADRQIEVMSIIERTYRGVSESRI
jgi:hypothetical protein